MKKTIKLKRAIWRNFFYGDYKVKDKILGMELGVEPRMDTGIEEEKQV